MHKLGPLVLLAILSSFFSAECTNLEIVNSTDNLSDFTFIKNNLTENIKNISESILTIEKATPDLELIIDVSRFTVCPGGEFTYTIEVCNFGSSIVTDIEVKDVFNESLELISASPEPKENGLWYISKLKPGECFSIMLTFCVPVYDPKFNGLSRISGNGFANIHNDYSTISQQNGMYNLRNCVYVEARGIDDLSDCIDVLVADIADTTLKERAYGSGSYYRDNIINIARQEKGSIQYSTSLNALNTPTSLTLPNNRSLGYRSRWADDLKTNVGFTGGSVTESYHYTNDINKNSSVQLNWNTSVLKTDSEFNGSGQLTYIHQLDPWELDPAMRIDFERVKPSFEAGEDYAGSFRINETIETYEFGAESNRSSSGIGIVSNDKRIGTSLRTYEHGSGQYSSEESFQTFEGRVAKNIKATYLPTSYFHRPGKIMNASIKWDEGSWSEVKDVSFLGEGVSSADYLNKDSILLWQNELESQGNYTGRGWLKAYLKDEKRRDKIRLEEEYTGNYSIERKLSYFEAYWPWDLSHILVLNDGHLIKDVTRNIITAKYRITIINDGIADLRPVYVSDKFPAGTKFMSSSVPPSDVSSDYANWTFASLPIGQSLEIDLDLNLTENAKDLVNCVYVTGEYDRQITTTINFSLTQNAYNNDKLNITSRKIANIDPIDDSMINYTIAVENHDNRDIVARVTDFIPDGLMFINSSIMPQNNYSWILEIAPGETKYVDYLTQAFWAESFVNKAHINAFAVDGSGKSSLDVESNLSLKSNQRAFEDSYPSEWKPPMWGLNYSERLFDVNSILSGCISDACLLDTFQKDYGFRKIYGLDSGSEDVYGDDRSSEWSHLSTLYLLEIVFSS